MSEHSPIFKVTLGARGVVLERIKHKHPGYAKARAGAILRQRDAIELFRRLKTSGRTPKGSYTFNFLETARTFAMLRLQAQERQIQDNLDRILAYDGSAKSSDG